MPEYRFEPDTGLWYHRAARTDPAMSLFGVSYADGQMRYENRRTRRPSDLSAHLRTTRATALPQRTIRRGLDRTANHR